MVLCYGNPRKLVYLPFSSSSACLANSHPRKLVNTFPPFFLWAVPRLVLLQVFALWLHVYLAKLSFHLLDLKPLVAVLANLFFFVSVSWIPIHSTYHKEFAPPTEEVLPLPSTQLISYTLPFSGLSHLSYEMRCRYKKVFFFFLNPQTTAFCASDGLKWNGQFLILVGNFSGSLLC